MNIGSNIRTIRKRKHITIAQICETTGLSQGFMSQVETNKTSPSIATLSLIADALNVPLAYLLLKKEERMQVVRSEDRQITSSGSDRLQVEHLSSAGGVRMVLVHFPPGTSTGETPQAHEGKEVHLVIKGEVYAEQGEDFGKFQAGDSFSWNACVPHLVINKGDEPASVLIAIHTEADSEIIDF
ncbi:cupin domain-containing protein [Paenibacillus sp. FSL H7-0716]|uniref:DNA-binding protein n=1 Tax=Paenibacillus odorifer TaxID=189426 RepID=A0A1R0Z4I2_9BACL|nr:helix-turn-helix transcriptional regulator [Paenibacillus odorifer]AWV36310.1 DNA-binding protein [Paenibacillus odorifer]OME17057.1 DNA-binding protein [Paenibacillus odorifer]OME24556.1 DNA-binding protein [Paenibacillus odorifer]